MVEEKPLGQNQDNFFKYDTNTLAEVYISPAEAFVSFGLGLAGLINALINEGEHKILIPNVKPLHGLEPTKEDYEGKRFNPYLVFGGWVGSKTEYEWKPVTLREKKEEKPVIPQPYPYPYRPYGYPYPYRPYGYPYPYRPYTQISTNQSQSENSITVNPIPDPNYVPNWIKSIDEWLNKGG